MNASNTSSCSLLRFEGTPTTENDTSGEDKEERSGELLSLDATSEPVFDALSVGTTEAVAFIGGMEDLGVGRLEEQAVTPPTKRITVAAAMYAPLNSRHFTRNSFPLICAKHNDHYLANIDHWITFERTKTFNSLLSEEC
jgi:hypothetical protein